MRRPLRSPRAIRVPFSRRSVLLLAAVLASACARRSSETPSDAATRYPIEGVVRAVDVSASRVTLEHGAVPGLMGPMTMVFPVRPAAVVSSLGTGQRISATVVVDGDRYWLEDVRRDGRAPAVSAGAPASGSAGIVTPRPNRGIAVGDRVPDFVLTDERGERLRFSRLAGDPVAITFLYTRCPVGTACPLTTAKFSRLGADLAREGFGRLLTITVDPEHDTPPVLADYAKKAGANPARWTFLTGSPQEVAKVASDFGVLYYPDRGQIVHSQTVAVVDADGRLANIYYGETWEAKDVLRDMAQAKEKARKG